MVCHCCFFWLRNHYVNLYIRAFHIKKRLLQKHHELDVSFRFCYRNYRCNSRFFRSLSNKISSVFKSPQNIRLHRAEIWSRLWHEAYHCQFLETHAESIKSSRHYNHDVWIFCNYSRQTLQGWFFLLRRFLRKCHHYYFGRLHELGWELGSKKNERLKYIKIITLPVFDRHHRRLVHTSNRSCRFDRIRKRADLWKKCLALIFLFCFLLFWKHDHAQCLYWTVGL